MFLRGHDFSVSTGQRRCALQPGNSICLKDEHDFCPVSMYTSYSSNAIFMQIEAELYFVFATLLRIVRRFGESCHWHWDVYHFWGASTSHLYQSSVRAVKFTDRMSMHRCQHLTTTSHPLVWPGESIYILNIFNSKPYSFYFSTTLQLEN